MPSLPSPSDLASIFRFLYNSTRGYRLRPWASPYLRWRIETYWGWPAQEIDARAFWKFLWQQRGRLLHFVLWAGRMGSGQRHGL